MTPELEEEEKEEEEKEEKDDDDEGDPGIVIIFTNPTDVNAALGLPSVPNIVLPADVAANVPVLQQGCNPGESLSNLQAWLDAIGCSTAESDSLVRVPPNAAEEAYRLYKSVANPSHMAHGVPH